MVVPPIVDEIAGLPEELHAFYMYLRQTMGPYAQGPVALIARHMDECVFSADAMGLRPLWQIETPHDYIFSSEPGVVPVQEMVSEPQPMAPQALEETGRREAAHRRCRTLPGGRRPAHSGHRAGVAASHTPHKRWRPPD